MAKRPFHPQYQTIYENLKAQILQGAYAPGSRLPFERELCESYGVQRITVRKALDLLVQDGLICKHPGKGSFVRDENAVSDPPAISGTLLFAMDKSAYTLLNASAYNVQLFFLMERLCLARGCTLIYAGIADAGELGALAEKHAIEGAFLAGAMPEGCAELLKARNIPAICVNHAHSDMLNVLADNHDGMHQAVAHLAAQGHRRIAFLGAEGSVNSRERQHGFLTAAFEHGVDFLPELLLIGDGTYESSRALSERALKELRPTAIIAAGDMMALAAVEGAGTLGIHVPDDLSVIGFGNADLCRFCSPQLTSIGPSMQQLARAAVEHLFPLLHRPISSEDCYTLRIPVMLVERGSTAPSHSPSVLTQK